MRIVAGRYRSRELMTPSGVTTRPTTDRAREALFNVLTNLMSFHDADVLDLYAGTGALAFEAISRGAEHATLVENNRKAIDSIKKNAERLDVKPEIKLEPIEVLDYLKREPRKFHLVFADPPYDNLEALAAIPELLEAWLAEDGIAVVEHRTGTDVALPANATSIKDLKAGEASFRIFKFSK